MKSYPLVVEYLSNNHSFADLLRDHGVKVRRDEAKTKISLNYDQILIKGGDQVAEECRGLILRPYDDQGLSKDDWETRTWEGFEVVAWPMNRFYNEGDKLAAPVNWDDSGLMVMEKLDGTCTILYYDTKKLEWHVGTRAVPEADLPMNGADLTFRQLFEIAATNVAGSFKNLTDRCSSLYTYVFELTARENRIVVKYDKPSLTLLAVRAYSGEEIRLGELPTVIGVAHPKTWPIDDIASLSAFVNSCPPSEVEGAIVMDTNFNRIKVKSRAYILSSRTKDLLNVGSTDIIEALLDETMDDIINELDEDTQVEVEKIREQMIAYAHHIDSVFKDIKEQASGDRKTFAAIANSSEVWSAPLFDLYTGKRENFLDWAKNVSHKKSVYTQLKKNMRASVK